MPETFTKYRTLIADDEQPARERLRNLLSEFTTSIEIIGEAKNGLECLALTDTLSPDLLFLDIQMPGLNGFEVLKRTRQNPVVVFCTAYDEFALKAFETNSIDYIVKPVKEERIRKTIEKLNALNNRTGKQEMLQLIENYINQRPKKEITTIPVKLGDRMIFVRIEDIVYFSAEEKYVTIHSREGKTYLSDIPLKNLEEKLEGLFIRIHRSFLVNINRISEINKHFNGKFSLKLSDMSQTRLMSGRNYNEEIKRLMEI